MIYIGSDHAGFLLKEKIKQILDKKKIAFEDCGTNTLNSVDYPDIAKVVAKKVKKENTTGILICKTGIGMSISANKIKGIRAARVITSTDAKLAREHNDANILTLPGNLTYNAVQKIIDTWVKTKKSAAIRHKRRVKKIEP